MKHRMNHIVPSWIAEQPKFFITVNAQQRGLNHFCKSPVGLEILKAIEKYHENQKWFCSLALLMPDHVHMLVATPPDFPLARTMSNWKRWLAMNCAVVWQENFFEHRLRKDESEFAKSRYILENPVRKGFVEKQEDWPWVWNRGWVLES